MSIEIRNVSKQFGDFQALRDVSLDIASGELIALLGPSGCGKTTLLRIIAGMESPDSGQVYFDGTDTTYTHVRERRVGFVFQHYALFQHMSVFENVAFGLRVRPRATRPAEAVIRTRVMELLRLVQLDGLAARYPAQLSGGQRQRVALGRAIVRDPKVFLFDEPLSNLDAALRVQTRLEIAALQQAGTPRQRQQHRHRSHISLHDEYSVARAADDQGEMRAAGEPVPEIATTLGVSPPTLYRLLAERNGASA